MQTLIEDLLTYSRVGTRSKPFESCDSALALQRAVANLEAAVRETGAVITHGDLPTVSADFAQLTQLFQNLLSNAIKFRSEKPPIVRVEATREDDGWDFTVTDNGIGIQAEYFERIFVIFQRLHTRSEFPGTGIGLAICKKIVERHGGHIRVTSQPGAGTSFHFSIPDRTDMP